MALSKTIPWNSTDGYAVDINTTYLAIGGQVVTATLEVPQTLLSDTEAQQFVKTELAQKIAETLIENKHIEFTRYENPQTFSYIFRARVCVTPDTQVRELRINKIV